MLIRKQVWLSGQIFRIGFVKSKDRNLDWLDPII